MELKQVGANMTAIMTKKGITLFSYNTPVAHLVPGEGFYRTSKKWSVTTSRHINKWLDGAKAEERDQSWFDNLI